MTGPDRIYACPFLFFLVLCSHLLRNYGNILFFLFTNPSLLEAEAMNIPAFRFQECGNEWRPPKWEQTEAIYSELAVASESTSMTSVCRDSKAGREVGKLYYEKKKKVVYMLCLEVADMEAGSARVGHLIWLVWNTIWISLVVPELEAGTKLGGHWSSLSKSWLFWVIATGFVRQSCIVICDPDIIYLYNQSFGHECNWFALCSYHLKELGSLSSRLTIIAD